MSVREQVEDAIFLAQNQRYIGALTNLMLAVAASSRKTFPDGTKSLEVPFEKMGDREAFTLFLGGRIRKILFGDFGGPETGNSGISVGFKGKQYDMAYILYKFYRCELVHNGELPEDIEFQPPQTSENSGLSVSNCGLSVSISSGDKMVLDYGWIDLLVNSVVNARCNGDEFGINHYELVPNDGIDEQDFAQRTVSQYVITPGRFEILKHAVRRISPNVITKCNDTEVSKHFSELVRLGEINGGALTGLSSYNLSDRSGVIQPKGIEILRRIANSYQIVKV